jgi:hypothetical protein
VETINGHAAEGNEFGIKENIEGIPAAELDFILSNVNADAGRMIRQMSKAA